MNRKTFLKASALAMLFFSGIASSIEHENVNKKTFTVTLGSSRVIYKEGTQGGSLSINNPQDYPILVQSMVFSEDKKGRAPFIVTPPLFRLDAKQQSRLRIVKSGNIPATDRETLYWLCVKGVPPDDDKQNSVSKGRSEINIDVMVSICSKMIYRPAQVNGNLISAAQKLRWEINGNKLNVENPTPFYMNINSVSVGGKPVTIADYIAPFGHKQYVSPGKGAVEWDILTDLGGVSKKFYENK